MSETLIPGYYNTKINNHDWVIYMGGEKYFPAYPAIAPSPEPSGKIVKRYLVKDSSEHEFDYPEYDYQKESEKNSYPLTIKEAFVNENDETIDFKDSTWYVWKGYKEHHGDTLPDTDDWHDGQQIMLLTKTLEPSLPLFTYESNDVIMLTIDTEYDDTNYFSYTFVGLVKEYDDEHRTYDMCNCKARMYSFPAAYVENSEPIDYFQYDGEIVEYNGEKCYVWYRYDSNHKCESQDPDEYSMQKVLTNTLWINQLPFSMDSPEFVTWIDYDLRYGKPDNMPFNRVEYLPDEIVGDTITGMTENEVLGPKINLNVYTRLLDNYEPDYPDSNMNNQYIYDGQTMEWNGKTCYVWVKEDLYDSERWPYYILTNTLDITLPIDQNADYFEAALNSDDETVNYGSDWVGQVVKKSSRIYRAEMKEYNPPIYKQTTTILIK